MLRKRRHVTAYPTHKHYGIQFLKYILHTAKKLKEWVVTNVGELTLIFGT